LARTKPQSASSEKLISPISSLLSFQASLQNSLSPLMPNTSASSPIILKPLISVGQMKVKS